MTTVRQVGEFGLINRMAHMLPTSPDVIEGIGDDCAVVHVGERRLLVSCDLSIEEVHFRRSYMGPEDIGWRAAASAFSDIAAMAGEARFALVSLACPADTDLDYIEGIYKGISEAAKYCKAAVVGGDTAQSSTGIVLDVTVIGDAPGGHYVTRKGAKDGDYIVVTGPLGLAAAGLHALQHKHDAPALVHAHHRPQPRLEQARWLYGNAQVHAMIDISDGLLQDVGHLADAAGLGVDIEPDAIPIAPELEAYTETYAIDSLDFPLTGGEDYELAVAMDPVSFRQVHHAYAQQFGHALTCVGSFSNDHTGIHVAGIPTSRKGYTHF